MNRLDNAARARVIAALVEGCSLRAVCRMTGVAMNTVLKLLAELGEACDEFQDKALRGLPTTRVQCDEIWAFCYAKDRNVPKRLQGEPGVGSVWTWVAIDADSKLIVTWLVGTRSEQCATRFMLDVASRVPGRIQLTTDAHKPYHWAVTLAFEDGEVDYAQLIKKYAGVDTGGADTKYSPPVCCGIEIRTKAGYPDPDHVSTSYVERQNLTMRMAMRRYTRLTNGHSKKVQNHEAATALHFMHYNFCRKHLSLRGRTPAMAAGVTDRVWTLDDLIALLCEKPMGRVRKIGAPPESERRVVGYQAEPN
jgi:IS1 family transposase